MPWAELNPVLNKFTENQLTVGYKRTLTNISKLIISF